LEKFDYIICGFGCAGLLLANSIAKSAILADKKVLLLDIQNSTCTGHTFGFWDNGKNELDSAIACSWDKLLVANHESSIHIKLGRYRYNMIKGIDLYQKIKSGLSGNPYFQFVQARVQSVCESDGGAIVKTNAGNYYGNYVFNSIAPDYIEIGKRSEYISLWQHFKGWEITVTENRFDTSVATFMDFRVEQGPETRFGYVLPISPVKAFVEIIIFDKNIEANKPLDGLLKNYIANVLKITDYKIEYMESGIIPMTEYPFASGRDAHILNIGLPGGMVNSSTGYGFISIQKGTKQIVADLEKFGKPIQRKNIWSKRFHLYNNTLLDVLSKKRLKSSTLFFDFFKKNNPEKVLRFLDGTTRLHEELTIFCTVNIPVFVLAIVSTLFRSLRRMVNLNFKTRVH
jgi:lycopene beta-cyclase